MPISDFLRATGVLVKKDESGELYENVGRITVTNAAIRGVDQNLWAVLKICADELALWLNIISFDTGAHAKNSRHYTGRAADVNKITPITDTTANQAMLTNKDALRVVEYLLAGGFHVGEGQPWAAILFGPPRTRFNSSTVDHTNHLHCSLAPKPRR